MGVNIYSKLEKLIKDSNKIVVFTGAGISSESGIPTYRGKGGLWTKYDPSIYANINYFNKDSTYYWNFFRDVRYPTISKAHPNSAHHSIVELEKQKKLYRIITQNIDGLHQMAGHSHVVELHGNCRRHYCLKCNKKYSIDRVFQMVQKELPPRCICGGNLRPDVVFFGEGLPEQALDEATIAAHVSDLFIVIGSSLLVYPASQIPVIAKEHGANLVIINFDPTPLDEIADLVFHENASNVLSKITF